MKGVGFLGKRDLEKESLYLLNTYYNAGLCEECFPYILSISPSFNFVKNELSFLAKETESRDLLKVK